MHDPYDSLVPLFRAERIPRRLHQHASCVFLSLNREYYLLTAAHVFDGLEAGSLLAPCAAGMMPLHGQLLQSELLEGESRELDNLDFALFCLSKKYKKELCHHFKPLPQTRTKLATSALELKSCSVSGYPISKGTSKPGNLSSEIYSFRGVAASAGVYDKLGLSPTENIVVHFHKDRAVHPGTLDPFATPSMKGVSGGGIFAWPDGNALSADWSLPSLVGIMHTYHEKQGLVVGTLLLPYIAAVSLAQLKGYVS